MPVRERTVRRTAQSVGELALRRGVGGFALPLLVASALAFSAIVPDTPASNAASILALVTTLVAGGVAIRRSSVADRWAWRTIYLGVLSAGSGVIAFGIDLLIQTTWSGFLGHGAVFAGYVLLVVGIARLSKPGDTSRNSDLDSLVDMSVVAVVAALLIWHFVGRFVLTQDRLGPAMLGVALVHELLVVVLAALIVRLMIHRRSLRGTMLLALGTTFLAVANLAYLRYVEMDDIGSWATTTWLGGVLVLGLAVTTHGNVPPTGEPADQRSLTFGRVALTMAPIPLPIALALWDTEPIGEQQLWLVAGATLLLTGLASLRGMRLAASARLAWEQLSSRERLYQALAANSSDVVLRVGRDGRPLPDTSLRAAGPSGTSDPGSSLLDDAAELEAIAGERFDELLARAAATPGTAAFAELPIRGRDETEWLSARAIDLTRDADVRGIVVNLHDITSRKHAEQELLHQALHDPLTGLANRALFRDRLEHALSRRDRQDGGTIVLYIDLDGFKAVNDGMGHDAGDRLLRLVAERLESAVRAEETVARLGGDEFAILIEGASDPQPEATRVAARVLHALTTAFHLDDRYVSVGASLGIAISDADSTAGSLLRASDVAMYQAKADGRGRWLVYEPSLDADTAERLQLESDLIAALDRDEFRVVYQPVMQLADDQVVGFEALVRWDHPTLGTVLPDRFIPIVERTGMIVPLGAWVLRTACAALADWQQRYSPDLRMSVNVSGRQLEDPELLFIVDRALRDHGLHPSSLVLEMTETVLVDNPLAAAQLDDLHRLGVRLAIDDFGTGYSSLSYLRRFPIDSIKIDRSFIATIDDPTAAPAVLRGLLDLTRTLELETVAEGIELDTQRDHLVNQRCALGQGFLYARPLPAGEAERILERTLVSTATPPPRHPARLGSPEASRLAQEG